MAKRDRRRRCDRERRLAGLLALTEVLGHGSDAEVGPFPIAACTIVLDMLDPELWRHPAAGINPLLSTLDNTPAPVMAANHAACRQAVATLRSLFKYAVDLQRMRLSADTRHRPLQKASPSWLRFGIRTRDADNERTYLCLFCDRDLATLAHGGKTIPAAWMCRINDHVHPCAMRYLRDTVLGQAPPARTPDD